MPDIKFSNQYPYTDFHELNLDWVIKEVKYWSTKVGKTIQSIELTGTAGLVDTYTINYSDGTTSTFDVTNGNGIASVAKTGTAGLVDTYTITFQDGSTSTFEVRNGAAAIDPTLTLPDYAADAKATGDRFSNIDNEIGKLEDATIYKTVEDIVPDDVVPNYVWYKYNDTTASYYASNKYGYKKYIVSNLPDDIIITTYTFDAGMQYVFVDANNIIKGTLITSDYKTTGVVHVPRDAVYLYINYYQNAETANFKPFGAKRFSTYLQKNKKESFARRPITADKTYQGYFIYSTNTAGFVKFEDNVSFTSYSKKVEVGDVIRLKSSYFAALAGYVLTDDNFIPYFVKHTTSSGSASYDDTITIQTSGYVLYTAYGTSAFYDQYDLIDVLAPAANRLIGKKIFFDGDSITMASGIDVVGYVPQIENITGCVAQNLAVDGGTLTSGTVLPGGGARHHVCESILNSDADTDIYCISGGYNDWGIGQSQVGTLDPQITDDLTQFDTTTLYGALDYIFTWIMKNRPGKPILFIMTHNPLNYRIAGGAYATAQITLDEWFGYIKNACRKYSVPVVDLFNNICGLHFIGITVYRQFVFALFVDVNDIDVTGVKESTEGNVLMTDDAKGIVGCLSV